MWQNHVIWKWVVRNIYQTTSKRTFFKAGNICHVGDSYTDKIKHDKNHPEVEVIETTNFKKEMFYWTILHYRKYNNLIE
jgi:hypothetical protein